MLTKHFISNEKRRVLFRILLIIGLQKIFLSNLLAQSTDSSFLNFQSYPLYQAIARGLQTDKKLQKSISEANTSIFQEKDIANYQLPDVNLHGAYQMLTTLRQYDDGIGHQGTLYNTYHSKYDATLSFTLPLYQGGKLQNDKKNAALNRQKKELKVALSKREMRLEIITGYLNVLHLIEQKKLIADNLKEDSANIKEVEALRRHGVVTRNEVLRTHLQASDHQLTYATIDNDIAIAEHRLQVLLDVPDSISFHIDTIGVIQQIGSQPSVQSCIEQALSHHESIQIAQKDIWQSRLSYANVYAAQLPSISMFGQYGFNYPDYLFFPPQRHLYSLGWIGVQINYPLSNLYKNKVRRQVALQQITTSEIEADTEKERVNNEVFASYKKLEDATKKIVIAQQSILLAQENYRIVRNKYMNQLAIITELVDADNSYLEARSSLITSNINQQLRYYQLQYAMGNL